MLDNNRLGKSQVSICARQWEKNAVGLHRTDVWIVRVEHTQPHTQQTHNITIVHSYISMCSCKLAEANQIHFSHTRYFLYEYSHEMTMISFDSSTNNFKHSYSCTLKRTSAKKKSFCLLLCFAFRFNRSWNEKCFQSIFCSRLQSAQ